MRLLVVLSVLCGVLFGEELSLERRGIRLLKMDDELAHLFGAPRGGLVVTDIQTASVWERHGLFPGTLILAVDGKTVKTEEEFWAALAGKESAKLTCAFGGFVEDVTLGGAPPAGGLLFRNNKITISWFEPTFKIAHDTPPPPEFEPCRLFMARNEYEPVQIVIHSDAAEFKWDLSADKAAFNKVVLYQGILLSVTRPTTITGRAAKWVDPLITAPRTITTSRREPTILWLLLHTKKDAPSGKKSVTLTLNFTKPEPKKVTLRIEVTVFGFTLPDKTHTRTAIGIGFNFSRWHGRLKREQKKKVWLKYLQVMSEHRLSPYNPFKFCDIRWRSRGGKIEVDTEDFVGEAPLLMRRLHFNSFRLNLPRRFGRHNLPDAGYEPFASQYLAAVARALKKVGLEDKAYAYWVDEPLPQQFEMVKRGMATLKRNAPWLRRLLTFSQEKAPCERFKGFVDIWVPVLHLIDPSGVEAAHKRGEEVWFYVCCVPRGRYPNLFIDQPGIHHRILFWLAERWRLDGFLYWNATFWRTRNPWFQTQSLIPKRKNSSFGAGDGLLLYPPSPKENPKKPILKGPVVSYRIEMLREGLEDREYFWLLRKEFEQLRRGRRFGLIWYIRVLEICRRVLGLSSRVAPDATGFINDARVLRRARALLAASITALRNIRK